MGLHKDMTSTNVHVVHAYTYATQATLWAASGFTAADVGKVALVSDDDSLWLLQATTPIWLPISGCARCKIDSASISVTGAAYGLDVIIPDNFVLAYGYYDVVTTFQSATDAATLAIHVQAANDIVAAVAISAATDWDSGRHAVIQTWAVANMIKMTANREVTVTLGGAENLTAGLLYLYLYYYQSA